MVALLEVRPARYHYVVIVGWTADDVIYHDPADAPVSHKKSRKAFEKKWARAGHWTVADSPVARLRTDVSHCRAQYRYVTWRRRVCFACDGHGARRPNAQTR